MFTETCLVYLTHVVVEVTEQGRQHGSAPPAFDLGAEPSKRAQVKREEVVSDAIYGTPYVPGLGSNRHQPLDQPRLGQPGQDPCRFRAPVPVRFHCGGSARLLSHAGQGPTARRHPPPPTSSDPPP